MIEMFDIIMFISWNDEISVKYFHCSVCRSIILRSVAILIIFQLVFVELQKSLLALIIIIIIKFTHLSDASQKSCWGTVQRIVHGVLGNDSVNKDDLFTKVLQRDVGDASADRCSEFHARAAAIRN
jgi:hypothetical protein